MADNIAPPDYEALATRMAERQKQVADDAAAAEAGGGRVIDYGELAREMKAQSGREVVLGASGTNPDTAAKAHDLSRRTGLPFEVIEGNEPQVEASAREAEAMRALENAPSTSQFLLNPEFAKVASDDTEQLSTIENLIAGIAERAAKVASGAARMLGTTAIGQMLQLPTMLAKEPPGKEALGRLQYDFTGEGPILQWVPGEPIQPFKEAPALALARELEGVSFGYQPGTTWEDVKDSPLINFLPFALEQGIVSTPDMVSVLTMLPAYIVARTGEIGQERAVNDGRADATVADFFAAAPASLASAWLERLGARGILGIDDALQTGAKREIPAAVAKAGAKEGITEFGQEIAEYTAETVGTKKGFDPAEALDRGLAGAVGGVGFGGTVRGVTASVESVVRARQAEAGKDAMDELQAASEASKLNERAPDIAAEHRAAVLTDNGVEQAFIPAQELQTFLQSRQADADEVLRSLGAADQMQEALAMGGDVKIDAAALGRIIGSDMYAPLSEHIRLTEDGMTPAEAKEYLSSIVKEEMQAVERSLEGVPDAIAIEAERVRDEVEQQLMKVGRSAEEARYGAILAAQRFATRARRAGTTDLAIRLEIAPEEGVQESSAPVDQSEGARGAAGDTSGEGAPAAAAPEAVSRDTLKQDAPASPVTEIIDDQVGFDLIERRPDGTPKLIGHFDTRAKADAAMRQRQAPLLPGYEIISDQVGFDLIQRQDDGSPKLVGHFPSYQQAEAAMRRRAPLPEALKQESRGAIRFGLENAVISLGAQSDRSTFLHESGHLFLEQLKADAIDFSEANPQLAEDWKTVRDWWASRPGDLRLEALARAKEDKQTEAAAAIAGLSDARIKEIAQEGSLLRMRNAEGYINVAMHEQWARGTEDYFRTGQAPSVALQDAFNRFRAWLVSIYSALARRLGAEQLDVQFSDDVRKVMDRLLASDEEIEFVQQQYNIKALFESAAEIGMTRAEFETYQRQVARAADEAKTRQLKKHMNEVEREKEKWWQEERAKVREEIAAEVHQRPVYRALHLLARSTVPGVETVGVTVTRLDRAAVAELLGGEAELARLPRIRGRTIYATKKGEAVVPPDVFAQTQGFTDGETMLREMIASPNMQTAIEKGTDAVMLDRHGDLRRDPKVVEEALSSTHNDKTGELLTLELNRLREGQRALKPAFVRQWAKERIQTRRIRDIVPGRFLTAERKAGREAGKALRAGNRVEAARSKFRQLMNFQMAQQAFKVRERVEKEKDYLSRFLSPNRKWTGVDAEYIDRIRTILAAYQFGPQLSERSRTLLELRTLAEWAQSEENATLHIPQKLLDANEKTHYRDLTLDEWNLLYDTIRHIAKQGKLKKLALIAGEEREIEGMASEIADRLEALPTTQRAARREGQQNPGIFDKVMGGLASFDAALRKTEFLLEKIDGEPLGPAHRYIFQVFADAEAKRNDLTRATTKPVMEALSSMPRNIRGRANGQINVPELGRSFRRSELWMMAMNAGNESNYAKMLEGSARDVSPSAVKWSKKGIETALAHLGKEEWQMVQKVWDAFESMRPAVEEVYRRENGRSPVRVEAREVVTPYGTFKGGYFPMMYDSSRSVHIAELKGNSLEAMKSDVVQASVYSGMTRTRTGFSAPVMLDISQLPLHVERSAHYITHYEAVRTTRRLLRDQRLVRGITNKLGREYYDTLKNWVGDMASNGHPLVEGTVVDSLVETLRRNATIAIMGLSYTTTMAQLLGYATTVDALSRTPDGKYRPGSGARWLATGMTQYLRNPAEAKRKVFALSGEMRHRFHNTDREVRASLRSLAGKEGAWSQFQRFSLMSIAGIQLYMVDFPTWLGGFNQALARGETEAEAVQAADRILRTAQATGGLKDLSAVQRKRGVTQALTMFYSFFNLLYNLQAQALGDTKKLRDVPQLAARVSILVMLPAVLEGMFRNEWPKEDDEDDPALFYGAKALVYSLSSIAFLRDLTGAIEGFGYKASPIETLPEAMIKSVRGLAKGFDEGEEFSTATIKALVQTFGFAVGAPATQVNRIISAADAMQEGEEVSPYEFLVGPERK